MAKLACLVALVLVGVANAATLGYASLGINGAIIGGPTLLSHPYAGLGLYGAPIAAGIVGPSGSVISNPAFVKAAAAPGIDTGIDSVGPSDGALVSGGTTIIRGPSATLIASPGAIQSASNTGANINSAGLQGAPGSSAVIIPASATAILPGGPLINAGLIY